MMLQRIWQGVCPVPIKWKLLQASRTLAPGPVMHVRSLCNVAQEHNQSLLRQVLDFVARVTLR